MTILKTLVRYRLPAALLLAVAQPPANGAEEALGRLFFTREHRQNIDRLRRLNIHEITALDESPTLTINGMLTRSSGKHTSWINGVAHDGNAPANGVVARPRENDPGKVVVQAGDEPTTDARVGETLHRAGGKAEELLNGGRIVVKRPAAR